MAVRYDMELAMIGSIYDDSHLLIRYNLNAFYMAVIVFPWPQSNPILTTKVHLFTVARASSPEPLTP